MAKRVRLFKYIIPGNFHAYGPIEATSERAARRRLREIWEVKTTRGWEIWETTPEEEERLHRLLTSPEQMELFRTR